MCGFYFLVCFIVFYLCVCKRLHVPMDDDDPNDNDDGGGVAGVSCALYLFV